MLFRSYGVFAATRSLPLPRGWLVPKNNLPKLAAAVERLRLHGITMQEVAADVRLPVERFTIETLTKQSRAFQGHQEATLTGAYGSAQLAVPAGSLFIPANQALGRLAFYLLEPESDDSLATWNIIDGIAEGQTYPIYRVTGSRSPIVKERGR